MFILTRFGSKHMHRHSRGGKGPCAPKFPAYLVILYFERRRPQTKNSCCQKIRPTKILGWLRHWTYAEKGISSYPNSNPNWRNEL